MSIRGIHHIALIAQDLDASLRFYVDVLGFVERARHHREDRDSWKLDLELGDVRLELFTFPGSPPRVSRPEARGWRHLALEVEDLEGWHNRMHACDCRPEEIRRDPYTGGRFFFVADPDGSPVEFYEELSDARSPSP